MTVVTILCQVILVATSAFLILLILMHKGKGGGLSDLFGGGFSSNLGSSGVAEKNLNMFTVIVGIVWITMVLALALIHKFT
ncbi:MAG: preprotein translocase subunit SecG [Bifidobacteriaceae bacterium]|nr:preprotein translocase subunit SecG [Bifidobacteriaceae bacterium]